MDPPQDGGAGGAGGSDRHPLILLISAFFWVLRAYNLVYAYRIIIHIPSHLSMAAVVDEGVGRVCDYICA